MAFNSKTLMYSITLSAVERKEDTVERHWVLVADDIDCTGTVRPALGTKPTDSTNLAILINALDSMLREIDKPTPAEAEREQSNDA